MRSLLSRIWSGWKRVAKKIGDFQARLILGLFYFILLAPFALIVKVATDPLAIKARAQRGWHPTPPPEGPESDRALSQS